MSSSEYRDYFYHTPSYHIELGEIKRIEDKIPYLCEVDEQSKISCVFAQNTFDVNTCKPNGFNCNLPEYTVSNGFEHDYLSSCDQVNQWHYQRVYPLADGHRYEDTATLPLWNQRSNQSQGASVQGSFTVHHRGQSSIDQYDSKFNDHNITTNHRQEVPGMCHTASFVLETGPCH